jgi:hypothetical protein
MSSETEEQVEQDVLTTDPLGRTSDDGNGVPWHPFHGGPPPGPDAFSVEWQLGPRDDQGTRSVRAASLEEEAKLLERRLLRLYSIYHPSA